MAGEQVDKRLFRKLVLPLVLLALVSLGAHFLWDVDGLLVNIATEVLGIVITVAYVDWIVRRHDTDTWRGTDSRVRDRIEIFINGALSGVRSALGFGSDMLVDVTLQAGDVGAAHREVLRISEHVVEPQALTRIAGMDAKGWKRLVRHLQNTAAAADSLLDRFDSRLRPKQIELLLDIQQQANSALTYYSIVPEYAGIPADQFVESYEHAHDLQEWGAETTSKNVVAMLRLARQLSGTIKSA
jgi:hypothetical protein